MMAKIPVSIVLNESAPLIGRGVRGLRSGQVAYCGAAPRRFAAKAVWSPDLRNFHKFGKLHSLAGLPTHPS